jgi:hypothetical protein
MTDNAPRMWSTEAEIEAAPPGWYIQFWDGNRDDPTTVLIGPFPNAEAAEKAEPEWDRMEASFGGNTSSGIIERTDQGWQR